MFIENVYYINESRMMNAKKLVSTHISYLPQVPIIIGIES